MGDRGWVSQWTLTSGRWWVGLSVDTDQWEMVGGCHTVDTDQWEMVGGSLSGH